MSSEAPQDYRDVVSAIAEEVVNLPPDQDKNRYIDECVASSEWTFKPFKWREIARNAGEAYDTMICDVVAAVNRIEKEESE
jgi:hypothetical protein